jgi:hypothetical protein
VSASISLSAAICSHWKSQPKASDARRRQLLTAQSNRVARRKAQHEPHVERLRPILTELRSGLEPQADRCRTGQTWDQAKAVAVERHQRAEALSSGGDLLRRSTIWTCGGADRR